MTYFRNKFNEEFLFLCNEQKPKGGYVRLDKTNPLFFIIEKNKNNSKRKVKVIPLLLYNKIITTNSENDEVIEDYIVLCENKNDTIVYAEYDEDYQSVWDTDFICDIGVPVETGDLSENENNSNVSSKIDINVSVTISKYTFNVGETCTIKFKFYDEDDNLLEVPYSIIEDIGNVSGVNIYEGSSYVNNVSSFVKTFDSSGEYAYQVTVDEDDNINSYVSDKIFISVTK